MAEALKGIGNRNDSFQECSRSVFVMIIDNTKSFHNGLFLIFEAKGWDGFKDWIEDGRRSDSYRLALRKMHYNGDELVYQTIPELPST